MDADQTVEQALIASNRLLQALTEVQTAFIQGAPTRTLFDKLLSLLLSLTGSEYGFIGEVLHTTEGRPYLRIHAVTDVAWTPELRQWHAQQGTPHLDLHGLENLFGSVITSGKPVVANTPSTDPRSGGLPAGHLPLRSFLGLPFHSSAEMVGMVGVANRPGGYDDDVISFLQPFLATCCSLLVGLRSEQRRREAEEDLRRSEASFRTLIEQSPDAILIHREGTVCFANPTAVKVLGLASARELLGRPVTACVQPGHEAALTEPSSTLREVRFQHQEGRTVLGEVVTVLLPFDGQPATLCIARDITERRQVQERLLATERLASLGTLAAGVAHEINNPLAYILSNLNYVNEELTELVKGGGALEGSRANDLLEALRETLTGGHRVRDIVRDLRYLSRGGSEQQAPVDVHTILDSCVNMAWSEYKHRARLVKDYGALPLVTGNVSRLGQVFLNLLINAAQAIPLEPSRLGEIRLSTRYEEDAVVVSVQDTGVGIPSENLDRLFDPFFTTKPVGVGTGLGLSICQGIVSGMGGRITVESQPGLGSTFRIILPVAAPPPQGSMP